MEELNRTEIVEATQRDTYTFVYLYTPLCGTCQLASKILTILEETIKELKIVSANLNYMEELAEKWEVESVPCFIIFKEGKTIEKLYAIQSVDYMYKKIKSYIE